MKPFTVFLILAVIAGMVTMGFQVHDAGQVFKTWWYTPVSQVPFKHILSAIFWLVSMPIVLNTIFSK